VRSHAPGSVGRARLPDVMRAFVLAAGKGTRLLPLTLEKPKPAVPVGNRPLASFTIDHLRAAGATRVVMNAHHHPDVLERDLERAGVPLDAIVRERVLLGTGGGLRNAWPLLDPGDEPVVVMNADILFAPDLSRALAVHRAAGAIATMVVRPDPRAVVFGPVDVALDPDRRAGRVKRLLRSPATDEPLDTFMFTGVHVISPRAFADLPEQGCIVQSCYRRWVDRGERVAAMVEESPWRDLGTLEQYLEANVAAASAARDPRGVVARCATVEGALLDRCVVGAGAVVRPGARLSRVVVWEGATVAESLSGAVVTASQVVPVRAIAAEPPSSASDTHPS
jgi:mannose-1-phosphate guanylyltransferase